MEYMSCSIDEVIARIIRNTRVTDTSYIQDSEEWIPEAMGLLGTKQVKKPEWKDIDIHFFKAKLPCGLVTLKAVEYGGMRVREGHSSRTYHAPKTTISGAALDTTNGFQTIPTVAQTPNGENIYGVDLVPLCTDTLQHCLGLPVCGGLEYYTELGYIGFDRLEDGCVRVHYTITPLDENGLPLIPDNEDYKQALYLYVRKMMQGAGWVDKQYTIQQLDELFEKHAARARAQIRYPSVDSMEGKVERMTRFVPPTDYFDSFFNSGPERSIIKFS